MISQEEHGYVEQYDKEQLELVDQYKEIYTKVISNFPVYAHHSLRIRDRKGRIIPFDLNPAQKKVFDAYRKAREEGKLLRFIVLKARREGVSTLVEGLVYQRTKNQFNRRAAIVAHEIDSCNVLFDMFKTFNEYDGAQAEIEHSNEKKLSFAKLKSEVKIKSAEGGGERSKGVKRGDEIQDLHCSEVAFWTNPAETMLALLQTVPDENNTMIWIESTANGVGGWFYDNWQKAVKGETNFIPIFLAWSEMPEYRKELQPGEVFELDEEEKLLKEAYNLDLEQLNWRRFTIANKCDGDVDKFKQEYPINAEEAFIASGRPVFDQTIVMKNKLKSQKPHRKGDLVVVYDEDHPDYRLKVAKGETGYYDLMKFIKKVEFIENEKGFISEWFPLQTDIREHNRWCAGADVAEGLEQGDFDSMSVLDRKFMRTHLTWQGHINADMLAEEQHKISLYLKNCWFNTEMNNHGLTTISKAFQLRVNQYWREDFSKGLSEDADSLGFKTTSLTRPFIINTLNEWIREGFWIDNDEEFWNECLTFVKNSKGKMQAQNKDVDSATKCFDDRVFARALMIVCHLWLPNYIPAKPEMIFGRPSLRTKEKIVGRTKF